MVILGATLLLIGVREADEYVPDKWYNCQESRDGSLSVIGKIISEWCPWYITCPYDNRDYLLRLRESSVSL